MPALKTGDISDQQDALAAVVALVQPQWRAIPNDIPDATVDAYRMGRNEVIDQIRAIVGMPVPTGERCVLCGEPLVWDEGNGGQWLGAVPPRDWIHCGGVPEGSLHTPAGLDDADVEDVALSVSLGVQEPEERFEEALAVTAEWLLFNRDQVGMNMIASAHTKAAEEAAELAENPDDISEWADTVQCLVGVALQQRWSVDQLADALQEKNGINAARKWTQKDDGTWQHVPQHDGV